MSLGYIVSIEIKETKTCKSNIKTWNIGKHENCRIGCCQWQRTCVISKRDNTGHVRGELFEGRLLLGVRGQSLGLPNQLNYLRCALPIWKIISSYLILNSETRIDCRYHPPPPKKNSIRIYERTPIKMIYWRHRNIFLPLIKYLWIFKIALLLNIRINKKASRYTVLLQRISPAIQWGKIQ